MEQTLTPRNLSLHLWKEGGHSCLGGCCAGQARWWMWEDVLSQSKEVARVGAAGGRAPLSLENRRCTTRPPVAPQLPRCGFPNSASLSEARGHLEWQLPKWPPWPQGPFSPWAPREREGTSARPRSLLAAQGCSVGREAGRRESGWVGGRGRARERGRERNKRSLCGAEQGEEGAHYPMPRSHVGNKRTILCFTWKTTWSRERQGEI